MKLRSEWNSWKDARDEIESREKLLGPNPLHKVFVGLDGDGLNEWQARSQYASELARRKEHNAQEHCEASHRDW